MGGAPRAQVLPRRDGPVRLDRTVTATLRDLLGDYLWSVRETNQHRTIRIPNALP